VILAGGKGVRLRPYTTTLPKPLVPLGDECAILEVVLRQLARAGVGTVSIAIGHLGKLIRAYAGDGRRWGLDVDYWEEDLPLGTVGPLVRHRDELPDAFLVMNGDILTDLCFDRVLDHHRAVDAEVTVATFVREVPIDFGVVEVADERIVGFQEKPTLAYTVSMGVYALSRRVLERYEPGMPLGFDDLLLDQIAAGGPARPQTYPFDGFWLDIGRPEDYDRANELFPVMRSSLIG
jgi:mannose-1-phosphate guanylyltransferase